MRELTEKIVIEGKSIVKDFQLGDTRTRVLKSISLKVSQGELDRKSTRLNSSH